jgi:hypothetical protein
MLFVVVLLLSSDQLVDNLESSNVSQNAPASSISLAKPTSLYNDKILYSYPNAGLWRGVNFWRHVAYHLRERK